MNKIRKKIILSCVIILFSQFIDAQVINHTQILNNNIKTLRVKVNDDPLALPIIKLNGSDVLNISFDDLSYDIHSYSYTVQHCNVDWTLSELSSNEYISGYNTGDIDDYDSSINTTVLYTHYNFTVPNDQMNFTRSGNYVLSIYQDTDVEHPIAKVCFQVVDSKIDIDAGITGNTDVELNGRFQQINFNVLLKKFYVRDPQTEIKVIVKQNNRFDNEVTDIKPTFFNADKLEYSHNRSLIFEGGSEYHRFDISSIYNFSDNIRTVKFENPNYQAYLYPNGINTAQNYVQDYDVNGGYVINYQNYDNDDLRADYIYVNFYLEKSKPFFDGNVFLGGGFDFNQLNNGSQMEYDFNTGMYTKKIMLKQGGYNYQYWLQPYGKQKSYVAPIDGSFWQTQNQYAIYIYYRGFGDRYDQLIGVKILN